MWRKNSLKSSSVSSVKAAHISMFMEVLSVLSRFIFCPGRLFSFGPCLHLQNSFQTKTNLWHFQREDTVTSTRRSETHQVFTWTQGRTENQKLGYLVISVFVNNCIQSDCWRSVIDWTLTQSLYIFRSLEVFYF